MASDSMFQITGVSSGIDWGSIIDKTIEAGKKPATQWQTKIDTLEVKKTLYNQLSSEFYKLRNTLTPLKLESTYLSKQAEFTVYSPAGADAASIATATVRADAEYASWEIEVEQIAKAQRHISARVTRPSDALNITGKFRIIEDERWTTIEVEASDTIRTLNQKIQNSKDQFGNTMPVSAKIIDNRIVIESLNAGLLQNDNKLAEEFQMGSVGYDITKNSVTYLDRAGLNYSVKNASGEYGVQSSYPPQILNILSNGTSYIEGTDFTYDATKGTITWLANDKDAQTPTNPKAKRPASGAKFEIRYMSDESDYTSSGLTANATNFGGIYDSTHANYDPTYSHIEVDDVISYIEPTGTGSDYSADTAFTVMKSDGTKYKEWTAGQTDEDWDYYVDRANARIIWNQDSITGRAHPLTSNEQFRVIMGGHTEASGKTNYSSADNKFYLEADDMTSNSVLVKLGFYSVDSNNNVALTAGSYTEAQDAKLTLDGVPVTRQTNSIGGEGAAEGEELIAGVTLELKGPGKVAMNITQDAQKAVESTQAFIDQYNQVLTWVNNYLTEKSTKTKADDEDEDVLSSLLGNTKGDTEFGLLHGDTLLSSIKSQMRNMLSNPISSFTGTLNTNAFLYPAEALDMEGSFYINKGGMSAKISVSRSDSLEDIQAKLNDATSSVADKTGALPTNAASLGLTAVIENGHLVIKPTKMTAGTTQAPLQTLTRSTSGNNYDYLPYVVDKDTPTNGVIAITRGSVAYREGTDFRIERSETSSGVIQSRVVWLEGGNAPTAGASYNVNYAYNASAISYSIISDTATGGGPSAMRSLSQLGLHQDAGKVQLSLYGITTEAADYGKSGLLEFDSDKFFEAIKSDARGVATVMTTFMRDTVDKYIGNLVDSSASIVGGAIVTKGRIAAKVQSIDTEIGSLGDQITKLEKSLAAKQESLYKKYTAMEQAIQKMNAQMSSISKYFDSKSAA